MGTSEKIKERLTAIDSLRGIAILGVMVLHSDLEGLTDPARRAILGVFDWSVLAFLLISGYLQNYEIPLTHVFRKRFVGLIIPFIVYNVVYNLFFLVFESPGIAPALGISVAKLEVGQPWWCWAFVSPAFQLYFLPYLFAITILSHGVLGRFSETTRKKSAGVILVLLPLLYLISPIPVISHGASLAVVPFYMASFLLGGLLRLSRIWHRRWAVAFSGVILALLIFCSSLFPHPGLSLAIVGVLFIFVMNTWTGVNADGSGMALLGRCSGSIYLWHTPLLMPAVSAGLFACGFISSLTWLLNIGISLAICIGVRLALEKIVFRGFGCSLPRVVTL
ncbi:acyltransferase family protein [Akkermansiaceae bacterium]|nr:acyltransferase family protein [Akkermansiaceae bacterium]MDC1205947.1 acyltransferase family protein [Akkermansiaceae bacterium]